jgi:hypothetical protein
VTIPSERTRALIHTYELLRRLQDPQETPRMPRWLRGHAKALLRHYPDRSSLQLAHMALPHLFGPVPVRGVDVEGVDDQGDGTP